MKEPLLKLENIAVGYNGRPLYSEVNDSVESGSLVAFLGENGAGKSTLLRSIAGRLKPLAGDVKIAGTDIAGLSRREMALTVSIVATGNTLAGALTVTELVSLGRQPHTGFFGRLSERDRRITREAIASTGMTPLAHRQVATLSDGERQKVMIARALAQETPVMLLDEPAAFLDVASRLETLQLLATLAREEDKIIIFSTHDVSSALRLASRLWLLEPSAGSDASTSGPHHSFIAGPPASLIASGHLARLFPDRAVNFDPVSLDFLPQ